ncbi:MAG: class I SAM-dependent methyltransferase [Actinomycetota bacterium]|nr:class I SAM-dependent methyltransferase [Actinomycetota bacterium]
MTSRLAAGMTRAIARHQRREILGFMRKAAHARSMAFRDHYSRIAEWYSSVPGDRVLELGCGPGRYVPLLHALGARVTAVDPYEFPLWSTLSELPGIDFRSGVRAEDLPFGAGTFDGICCLGALLYFDDPERALAEMSRVLVPGGRLLVRTVNRDNAVTRRTGAPLDPASRNLYTSDELTDLLTRAGFFVTTTYAYGFWPARFRGAWWFLVNGPIPIRLQETLSGLVPAEARVNVIAAASKGASA